MVFISVDKKVFLIFCKELCQGCKGKPTPQRPVLHGRFFLLSECFACVPAPTRAIARVLFKSLDAMVFTMMQENHRYFFRFANSVFFTFSLGKIRTPKKSITPQRF